MTGLLVGGGAVLLALFLLANGRGRMGSERFARRYPLLDALHREAEAKRAQERLTEGDTDG